MLLVITAIWGYTFTVVKDAIEIYGVYGFLAVRFLIGTICLAPFALPRLLRQKAGKPSDTPIEPDIANSECKNNAVSRSKSLKIGLWIGVCLGFSYLFQTLGLDKTTASHSGLITGLAVLFGPLVALIIFRIRVAKSFWPAVAVAIVGLALLTGGEKDNGEGNSADPQAATGAAAENNGAKEVGSSGSTRHATLFGDGLSLLCALGFGIHIALLGRYAVRCDAIVLAFGQLVSATVFFWLIWLASGERLTMPTGDVWWAILLTGIVATAGGFFVQTYAQQHLSVVRTSVIIVMEPIFASIFGYLLHHDPFSKLNLVGAVLMIGAALFVELHHATTAAEDSC